MAEKRYYEDRFLDDVKRILGDEDQVMRSPPSRAEHEAIKELQGWLWGHSANPGGAELISDLAGCVHTPAEEVIELHYAAWGGQALEYLPWPTYAPKCRIWLLKMDDRELLIAMTEATGVPDGHFPELNGTIAPRIQELFPGSIIEQRN